MSTKAEYLPFARIVIARIGFIKSPSSVKTRVENVTRQKCDKHSILNHMVVAPYAGETSME